MDTSELVRWAGYFRRERLKREQKKNARTLKDRMKKALGHGRRGG